MSELLHDLLVSRIRRQGPVTVADYMELALYHPDHGYYASAARRSGRDGDFYTSVDVGPLFGELIAVQLAELWPSLRDRGAARLDLVEAGAGDARLMLDILDAARRQHSELYDALRVTIVDRSPSARRAQGATLHRHRERVTIAGSLPRAMTGVIVANELLDALPVHLVVMRQGHLREVHVIERGGQLRTVELAPSTPKLDEWLRRTGRTLPEGAAAEVGLAAVDWIARAGAALASGYLLLFDYAHEAADLYSGAHVAGTLATYRNHTFNRHHWLTSPGQLDITSHVNIDLVREAARDAGFTALGAVDQTYFLLALGLTTRLEGAGSLGTLRRRLAARSLVMPGGLGSTIKAFAFGRNVGVPRLRGFSTGRLT